MKTVRLFDKALVLDRITQAFIDHDRKYVKHKADAKTRLSALQGELKEKMKHNSMSCSLQHYYEAKWLQKYSDDWKRFYAECAVWDTSMDELNQPDLAQQPDGSWGPCYEAWYRKLEPTVDALQLDTLNFPKLGPLTFMSCLQDPDLVVPKLQDLKTSDIARTGWNKRDEYGAMLTALSQLLFKQKLLDRLSRYANLKFSVSQTLIDRYKQFLWDAQDKKTGYWGPYYIFGSDLAMIPDLSFTFHVAHYYMEDHIGDPKRKLPNLDKVVGTTLDIKDQEYPNGWLQDGKPTDHNNYDVAVLFACSWQDANATQREKVRNELQRLANWCVLESLEGDHFRPGDLTIIESYYYGVRFLDTIGLWDPAKRFWRNDPIPLPHDVPTAEEIRTNLRAGFAPHKDGSEYSETISEILGP